MRLSRAEYRSGAADVQRGVTLPTAPVLHTPPPSVQARVPVVVPPQVIRPPVPVIRPRAVKSCPPTPVSQPPPTPVSRPPPVPVIPAPAPMTPVPVPVVDAAVAWDPYGGGGGVRSRIDPVAEALSVHFEGVDDNNGCELPLNRWPPAKARPWAVGHSSTLDVEHDRSSKCARSTSSTLAAAPTTPPVQVRRVSCIHPATWYIRVTYRSGT